MVLSMWPNLCCDAIRDRRARLGKTQRGPRMGPGKWHRVNGVIGPHYGYRRPQCCSQTSSFQESLWGSTNLHFVLGLVKV